MEQPTICANCSHENDANAQLCAYCGMPLQFDRSTPPLSMELRSDPTAREAEGVQRRTPPHVIALHVVNATRPILIPYYESQRIVLGRNMPEGDFFSVDLSDFRAQALGVSRQHATIYVTEEGCLIEDLSSTNGTWLNELRLVAEQPHSIQSGDLIRLGHLMVFISFRE
jgi:hypothetical protein